MEIETFNDSDYEVLKDSDYRTVGSKNIDVLNDSDYEVLNENNYEVLDKSKKDSLSVSKNNESQNSDFSLLDIPKSLAKASSSIYEGAGWAIEKLGNETGVKGIEDYGTAVREVGGEAKNYWEKKISKSAKDISRKKLVVKDDIGDVDTIKTIENIITSPDTVAMMTLESLPATGLGIGVGGLLAKGFSLIPNVGNKVAAALGYSIGEGSIAAPMSGIATEEKINKMSYDYLFENSPEYRAALDKTEDKAKAKEIVVRAGGGESAANTFLFTAILSAPFGYVMAPILNPLKKTGDMSLIKAGLITGTEESMQESLQSGAEQVSKNRAVQNWADESQNIYEDVPEAMVAGATSGFAMGSTIRAGQQAMDNRAAPTKEEMRIIEKDKKFNEAINHINGIMPDATQEEKVDIANRVVGKMKEDIEKVVLSNIGKVKQKTLTSTNESTIINGEKRQGNIREKRKTIGTVTDKNIKGDKKSKQENILNEIGTEREKGVVYGEKRDKNNKLNSREIGTVTDKNKKKAPSIEESKEQSRKNKKKAPSHISEKLSLNEKLYSDSEDSLAEANKPENLFNVDMFTKEENRIKSMDKEYIEQESNNYYREKYKKLEFERAYNHLIIDTKKISSVNSSLPGLENKGQNELFDTIESNKKIVPKWAKKIVSDVTSYDDIIKAITDTKNGKHTELSDRAMNALHKAGSPHLKNDISRYDDLSSRFWDSNLNELEEKEHEELSDLLSNYLIEDGKNDTITEETPISAQDVQRVSRTNKERNTEERSKENGKNDEISVKDSIIFKHGKSTYKKEGSKILLIRANGTEKEVLGKYKDMLISKYMKEEDISKPNIAQKVSFKDKTFEEILKINTPIGINSKGNVISKMKDGRKVSINKEEKTAIIRILKNPLTENTIFKVVSPYIDKENINKERNSPVKEEVSYEKSNTADGVTLYSNPLHVLLLGAFNATEGLNNIISKMDSFVSEHTIGKVENTSFYTWFRKFGASGSGLGLLSKGQENKFLKHYRRLQKTQAMSNIDARKKAELLDNVRGDISEDLFNEGSIRYLENPDVRKKIKKEFPEIAKELDKIINYIDKLSNEAMQRGLMKQSQFNMWEGRYLSRLYIAKEAMQTVNVKKGITIGKMESGRKIDSIIDYLKENPKEAERINILLDPIAMIKQTISRTQSNIGIEDFLRNVIDFEGLIDKKFLVNIGDRVNNLPSEFSPKYAESVIIPYIEDLKDSIKREAINRELEFLKNNDKKLVNEIRNLTKNNIKLYKEYNKLFEDNIILNDKEQKKVNDYEEQIDSIKEQVDNVYEEILFFNETKEISKLPDTKHYGAVSGLPITSDMASLISAQMMVVHSPEMLTDRADKALSAGLGYLKWAWVPANIFAYPRNFFSNLWQWSMGGSNPVAFPIYTSRAVWSYIKKDKWYTMAEESGMIDTNEISYEINSLLKDSTESNNIIIKQLSKGMRAIGGAFGWVDNMVKVAQITYQIEKKGKTIDEAVDLAQNIHYDYSITYDLIRGMRDPNMGRAVVTKLIGTLFPTYTQKTIAFLTESIIKRPVTFALIGSFLALAFRIDTKDKEELEKKYGKRRTKIIISEIQEDKPQWMKNNPLVKTNIKVNKNGKIQVIYTDFSYSIPFGSILTASNSLIHGEVIQAMKGIGVGANPIQLFGDLLSNTDSFTKKDIYYKYDNVEMAKDILKWVGKNFAPGTITKLVNLYETRHPIAPRLIGINQYVYSKDELNTWHEYNAKDAINKAKMRTTKYVRKIQQAEQYFKDGSISRKKLKNIKAENMEQIDYWLKIGFDAYKDAR